MRTEILRRKKKELKRRQIKSRKLEKVNWLLRLNLEVMNVRRMMGLISPVQSVLNFVTLRNLVPKVFLRSMTLVKLAMLRTLV